MLADLYCLVWVVAAAMYWYARGAHDERREVVAVLFAFVLSVATLAYSVFFGG